MNKKSRNHQKRRTSRFRGARSCCRTGTLIIARLSLPSPPLNSSVVVVFCSVSFPRMSPHSLASCFLHRVIHDGSADGATLMFFLFVAALPRKKDGAPKLGWHDTIAYLTIPLILIVTQSVSMQIMQPAKDPSKPVDESQAASQNVSASEWW